MTARPWMPLYVPDYLADTGHMSTVEHGAYLLLIMHYWQTGGLPDDDEKLARVVRLPCDEWLQIRATVAERFQPGWRHKRIDAELERATAVMGRRSAAGKAGASARYGKRMANASQTDAPSQPQSQGKEPPNGGSKKRGTRLPPDFEPDVQTGIDAGLSRSEVLGEIHQFRDHFTAAPGQKGVRVDWPATWRMWCRNAAKWKAERNARGSHGPRQQPRSGHATAFEYLGDFAADEDGEVGWQVDASCFDGDDGTPAARAAYGGPVLAVIAGGEADAQGGVRRIGAPRGGVPDGERNAGGVDEAADGWLPDGGGGHPRLGLASRRG